MGQLGKAWTVGLQVGDGRDPNLIQVAVTLKHFVANSLEGGAPSDEGLTRHTVDVNLSNCTGCLLLLLGVADSPYRPSPLSRLMLPGLAIPPALQICSRTSIFQLTAHRSETAVREV